MRVASLPMYVRRETEQAHRAYWELLRDDLRAQGIAAPVGLSGDGVGYEFWRHPGLVLSQTCGYPYRSALKDHVNLVGTPDYGLQGCPAGYYHSVFIVHRENPLRSLRDLEGRPMAFNDDQSQSGYHGPLSFAAIQGVKLRAVLQTGSHRESINAIANRVADVAAIDVITWLDCQRHEPSTTSHLRVIAKTPPVPGLPLICARSIDPVLVLGSVTRAIDGLSAPMRQLLRLKAIVPTSPLDYSDANFAQDRPFQPS